MSLPPAYQPLADEEEDRKRKAQIEEMMRAQRESYFRNEPVQQEYRDIVDREEARRNAAEARREATERAAQGPGVFDVALAEFMERKRATESANTDSTANPKPQVVSLSMPGALPDDDADDAQEHFSPDAMLNGVAKAAGFNHVGPEDRLSATPRPYRVAQFDVPESRLGAEVARPSPSISSFATFDIPLRRDGTNRVEEKPFDQLVRKMNANNPVVGLGEWMLDFDKYSKEVDQFANSNGIKGTITFQGKPVHTDQQSNNAFAHAAASALYAYDKGNLVSKFIGDARETENYITNSMSGARRRLKNVLTGRTEDPLDEAKEHALKLDIYKDLFNNSIGKEIGKAAKAASLPRSEVLNKVLEALKIGKLITDEYVDPRVDKNFDGNPRRYRPPPEKR